MFVPKRMIIWALPPNNNNVPICLTSLTLSQKVLISCKGSFVEESAQDYLHG